MKTLFFALLGIFFASCAQQNNSDTAKAEINTGALKSITIQVNGMTCEGCQNTVETAILSLNGVEKVEASFSDLTAIVSFDTTQVDYLAIKEKINKVGYEAAGLKGIVTIQQ